MPLPTTADDNNYLASAARAVMCGFGVQGYALAIDGLAQW